MFGQKKKKKEEQKELHQKELRKGLLFWLPGGSSRLDVYLDYCVIRCLGKTKMAEKERVIPFDSITKVVYIPAKNMANGSLQIFTREMPDVKRNFWYAYENNLVVVHPSTVELAKKIQRYITNPSTSDVPPELLNDLKKQVRHAKQEEAEKAKEEAWKEKEKVAAAEAAQDAEETAD